jgi:hypothetical protein
VAQRPPQTIVAWADLIEDPPRTGAVHRGSARGAVMSRG